MGVTSARLDDTVYVWSLKRCRFGRFGGIPGGRAVALDAGCSVQLAAVGEALSRFSRCLPVDSFPQLRYLLLQQQSQGKSCWWQCCLSGSDHPTGLVYFLLRQQQWVYVYVACMAIACMEVNNAVMLSL